MSRLRDANGKTPEWVPLSQNTSIRRAQKDRSWAPFFKGNRFALLAGVLVIMLLLILIRTGSLQIFSSGEINVLETVGSDGEIVLEAPRGDIVDRDGRPLAVSDAIHRVSLISTGMTNAQLNRFLLDVAILFDEFDCSFRSPLLNWFDVPSDMRGENLLARDQSLSFVFRQPLEDIIRWQTDPNVLNLVDPEKANTARKMKRVVRERPDEFFDYLLFDYFQIEPDRTSGSRLYSDGEAFLIMQLRYLILENNWLFSNRQPITLSESVPASMSARLVEQNYRYPGLIVTQQYHRRYTDDSRYVGHALGYIGAISANEYARLQSVGYGINDIIGKTGVEQAADRYLRGVNGLATFQTWQQDQSTSPVLVPGEVQTLPIPGNEVKMTIDLKLQKRALEELERKIFEFRGSTHKDRVMEAPGGCVVVLDAKTGAVLVNANYPNFDPSDFINQTRDPDAARRVRSMLTDTKYRPLLNRAIAETYTPGSTFKAFSGMAALEAGVVTSNNQVRTCRGSQEIGGIKWHCYKTYGHGNLTFARGMATSCNLYFFQNAVLTGIDTISETARRVGLGENPGLDITGGVSGIRPSRAVKKQLNARPEDQRWFIADTCQTSIGQFYNSYTMMEMARGVTGLATNYLVTPHFIKEIVSPDGTVLVPEKIERVPIGFKEQSVKMLRDAMISLSKDMGNRTGRLLHDFPYPVACKTGTAEAFNEKMEPISNSVFVCFAPAHDPEIVIAHAISDGAYGEYSSDISYRILCEYFGVEPTHERMGNFDTYRGR